MTDNIVNLQNYKAKKQDDTSFITGPMFICCPICEGHNFAAVVSEDANGILAHNLVCISGCIGSTTIELEGGYLGAFYTNEPHG